MGFGGWSFWQVFTLALCIGTALASGRKSRKDKNTVFGIVCGIFMGFLLIGNIFNFILK